MFLREWMRPRVLNAEGEGAGGGEGEGAGDGGNGGAVPWYQAEGAFEADELDWMKNRGLIDDDPGAVIAKAVRGHRAAEIKLGRGADAVLDKPGEGQALPEYLRAHGDVFGVPGAPEAYTIERPEMPQGLEWSDDLEARARSWAHENGLSNSQLQAAVKLQGELMAKTLEEAQQQLETARQEMTAKLRVDWGKAYQGRVDEARAALGALAEEAGLDGDSLAASVQLMSERAGDAAVMKLFWTMASKLGEAGVETGGGGGGGYTPERARAELAAFIGPEGEYGKAYAAGDARKLRELDGQRERLERLAAGKQ